MVTGSSSTSKKTECNWSRCHVGSGSSAYVRLGIPQPLAGVLRQTVGEVERSFVGRENEPWVRLTKAALHYCVWKFAGYFVGPAADGERPDIICSAFFSAYADELRKGDAAVQWGVHAHMLPVVSGILTTCGQLVVQRSD
ncbi:conserved hypothetical protein [Burkholderia sp. 8Y]|nr:conserved hypothetical protein [Burkholderia sp. 8Y]